MCVRVKSPESANIALEQIDKSIISIIKFYLTGFLDLFIELIWNYRITFELNWYSFVCTVYIQEDDTGIV